MLRTAIFLLLLCSAPFAQSSAAIDILKASLNGLDAFSADFSQRLIDTESVTVEPSLGRMVFKRPGKFRWIYETPYEQEVISDGKTLWVFDKDLEQVTIRSADNGLDRSPITILDAPEQIADLYEVTLLSESSAENEIKLVPKYENAGFKYVVLIFTDNKLVAMEIYDNFDQYNSLTFHNIELNSDPEDQQFSFVPPANVDVINATEQPN